MIINLKTPALKADVKTRYNTGRYFLMRSFLWMYTWYTQYLVMHYSGLPAIPVFRHITVTIISIVTGFLIPLIFLLPKKNKQNLLILKILSVAAILSVTLDLFNFIVNKEISLYQIILFCAGSLLIYLAIFLKIISGSEKKLLHNE